VTADLLGDPLVAVRLESAWPSEPEVKWFEKYGGERLAERRGFDIAVDVVAADA
jgi:hypothetical protein